MPDTDSCPCDDHVRTKAVTPATSRVGLALSGGGSRAIAFHLGCLRALHRAGILARIDVISTVSGGSVIGALYASHDGDFDSFDARTSALLKEGLVGPTLKTALSTPYGILALLNWLLICFVAVICLPYRFSRWALIATGVGTLKKNQSPASRIRRIESRTTLLARTLDTRWFQGKTLDQLSSKPTRLMINACDLTHGSAFYFSPTVSGSWRLGALTPNNPSLAEAVAASAAYPLALPALDKHYRFTRQSGQEHTERISLTDGGVYDNTALSPFWPTRDKDISLSVDPVSTVIACRAGYGIQRTGFAHFLLSRLQDAYSVTQNRAENASIQRLFEQHKAGAFRHVLLPFLGQEDSQLMGAPDDLISRESVWAYPTNFFAMDPGMIHKLTRRGEQLTTTLLHQHAPELLSADATSCPSETTLPSLGTGHPDISDLTQ